ncbi:MAG: TIGR01841 family phasin [Burkholderiales bacterium]|nr:TIGR01841 family phasin [Burkholderiales bacterium]
MSTLIEQLTAAQKENIATSVALATIAATAAERSMDLNVGAIKSAISSATENGKAIAEVKDVQAMTALQSQLAQPTFDALAGYLKDSYDIVSEAQNEFSKVVEAKMIDINKILVAGLDQAEKNAPSGSDMAFAALRTAVAAANQTYDAIAKASKQVQEVTSVTVSAPRPASTKRKSAAA